MFKKTVTICVAIVAATMSMHGVATAAAQRHMPFHSRVARHVPRQASEGPRFARSPRRVWTRYALWPRYALSSRFAHSHRVAARRSMATSPDKASSVSGVQTGRASFYGGGGLTAAGGRVGVATCAHRWLPFGTRVLVTNLVNAHRAVLTVNDRGPFVRGRIVDVSVGAAGVLGMLHTGTAPVSVQVVGHS